MENVGSSFSSSNTNDIVQQQQQQQPLNNDTNDGKKKNGIIEINLPEDDNDVMATATDENQNEAADDGQDSALFHRQHPQQQQQQYRNYTRLKGRTKQDDEENVLDCGDEDDDNLSLMDEDRMAAAELIQNNEIPYFTTVDRILAEKEVHFKWFWRVLLILSVFYMMPSIQFVLFQADGKVDCYYNQKCLHSFGIFKAFNNIISNILYILFGISFLIIVYFTKPPPSDRYGLHNDMSLNYTLGICLLLEGLFSSLYHVCPSPLNFQFDSTYMVIGIAVLMVSLYQKRHAMRTIGVGKFYGWMAVLNMINALTSNRQYISSIVWFIIFIVLLYALFVGSFHLYYHRQWTWDKDTIPRIYKNIRTCSIRDRPRFFVLLIVNIVTISVAIAGAASVTQFSDYVLSVFLVNLLLYLTYYIAMKARHREKVHWRIWVFLLLIIVTTSAALYFFNQSVTNKLLPIEESNELNQPCILFDYFDSHDVWHFLSATASFLLLIMVYTIDNGIQHVPRNELHVF